MSSKQQNPRPNPRPKAETPCGECFPFAYREVRKHPKAILVHATVVHPWDSHEFPHAWVERGGKAYDWQMTHVRHQALMPIADYYEMWKPKDVQRFTQDEATLAAARNRHYGPWTRKQQKPPKPRRQNSLNAYIRLPKRNPPVNWRSVCRDLRRRFDEFNVKVFKGIIPADTIIKCKQLKGVSGRTKTAIKKNYLTGVAFRTKPITILMSTTRIYESDEVDAILLHEMIHAFLYAIGNFTDNHGGEFAALATRVERETGIKVPLRHDTSKADFAAGAKLTGVLVQEAKQAFLLFDIMAADAFAGFAAAWSRLSGAPVAVYHSVTPLGADYPVKRGPPRGKWTSWFIDETARKHLGLSEATLVARYHPPKRR